MNDETSPVAADRVIARQQMVAQQIARRGVRDRLVLEAMRTVPREAFLPPDLAEFAYHDTPLPIAEEQTISQPYIVALMAEALALEPDDRVLEVGTGSGYAAAVLSRIAAEVYTIERHAALAASAAAHLAALGYDNVRVRHGDGTQGWPEHAPYDAIVAAAGGPGVPPALREQLAIGGRLVIPVGETPRLQELVRVTRTGPDTYRQENLGGVRFVPLVGAQGWIETAHDAGLRAAPQVAGPRNPPGLAGLIREAAEPLLPPDDDGLAPLLDRLRDARVVLLGEATHGTAEFYRFRARLTQELIVRHGFTVIAVEADWPDAARIDDYVRHAAAPAARWRAFARFPTWMWRNREVEAFVEWLRAHNAAIGDPARRASFHGMDLYSLYTSIGAILEYLEGVDPAAARVARERYGCLSPWQTDPATYGRAVLSGRYQACEPEVTAMLSDLLGRRRDYAHADGERFLDAVQNARLVANAEEYYRVMYYGARESWNLRDRHMFETLQLLLQYRGAGTRAVVWAHNSHLGDATATEMGARGELNVGQLCREAYGDEAVLVGFGTHQGTVAAASDWDGPLEIKTVRPSHADSYERLCHDSGLPRFVLPLRNPHGPHVRDALAPSRLERAIGVIYRPDTELQSHYFHASLPHQFDEYVWFDETTAITPLPETIETAGMPDTYPFGL